MALTHYGTLGVDRAASMDEIRAAYRAKASKAHPDRGGSEQAMSELNVAYRVLSVDFSRQLYNDTLKFLGSECGACDGAGRKYKQKGFTTRTGYTCTACNGEGVTAMRASKANVITAPTKAKRRGK